MKLVHEGFLGRAIEIDHDVPAENEIERVLNGETVVHQIYAPERNRVGKVRFHLKDSGLIASPAKEMTLHDGRRHGAKTLFVV